MATLLILLEILKINSFEAREGNLKGKIKISVFVLCTFLLLPGYKRILRMVFHSTAPRVTSWNSLFNALQSRPGFVVSYCNNILKKYVSLLILFVLLSLKMNRKKKKLLFYGVGWFVCFLKYRSKSFTSWKLTCKSASFWLTPANFSIRWSELSTLKKRSWSPCR